MALKKQKYYHHNNKHKPVLLADTLRLLAPQAQESYLDLTAGYGGHAQAILELTHHPVSMVLNDRDSHAIDHLADLGRQGAELIQQDYLTTCRQLVGQNRQFDMILVDLGASSPHFDNADRGFSFRFDGPLDMRMDQSQTLTASHIVNDWPVDKLAEIIKVYGQESRSEPIAQAIVNARPLRTTAQLSAAIQTVSNRAGRRHPATKSFQALRIVVNDEIGQLELSLPLMVRLLAAGGRLAVISFHSLEDRIVKRFFRQESVDAGYEAQLQLLTPRAIPGTNDVSNPRARSAKLRAARKIKKQKGGS